MTLLIMCGVLYEAAKCDDIIMFIIKLLAIHSAVGLEKIEKGLRRLADSKLTTRKSPQLFRKTRSNFLT